MWKFAEGDKVTAEVSWLPPIELTVVKQGAGYKKNKNKEDILDHLSYFLIDKDEKMYYFWENQLKG